MKLRLLTALIILGLPLLLTAQDNKALVRIGMIGLDTSHVPAFAKIFNDPKADGDLAGFKVVAGYPGGTDMPASHDRVQKFTEGLHATGVEIVDTIPKLLEKVDVVLLESVDGRIHLKEARPVIEAGKPLFIDKPLAGSLADAIAIADLAKKHQVPCFSASSLRFATGIRAVKQDASLGEIIGAMTWGPCTYQEGTPDLFFYGIHGIEALFTLMGTGCETVTRTQTDDADVVTGSWKGGHAGTYRGLRKYSHEFGAQVFTAKGITPVAKGEKYDDLCREIGRFFKTKTPPVNMDETLEIFAFMEAADESKNQGGKPVALKEVMTRARAAAAR